ncbi:MAG: hypothetical protein KKH67_15495 [candidate division Zixibacteria bacterium]|nr:hypothetical protein [candidate division Zixibacteria bacterium]MBU1469492.1 hypothetical protein [candidate division Zixibacteria bacterium]
MYALYSKQQHNEGHRYRFKAQTSLFGCNSGYIPYLLRAGLIGSESEPLPWHINIEKAMADIGESETTLMMNLKPNSSKPNLSLYEVSDVWGYSSSGWTPIMFYLRGLFVDADPSALDDMDFVREPKDIEDPIFSMMYLNGTIQEGTISGGWTPPGPSSTNSVLLWPEAFKYFAQNAEEIIERAACQRRA